jgi:hypothetical protein
LEPDLEDLAVVELPDPAHLGHGPDSPVRDPKTGAYRPRRADDPPTLKSDLAEPDLCFLAPTHVTVGDDVLFIRDNGNERIVRAALKYHAEAVVPVP